MKPPSRFRILHLSDFHFREAGAGARLAESLSEHLQDFRSVKAEYDLEGSAQVNLSAIVLSGDFREQRKSRLGGTVDWKKETADLITGLQQTMGWIGRGAHCRFLLVPGNHDATRDAIEPLVVSGKIKKEVASLRLLRNGGDIEPIAAKLHEIAEQLDSIESQQPRHYRPNWEQYNMFADAFYADVPGVRPILLGTDPSSPVAYVSNFIDELGVVFVLLHSYAQARTFADDSGEEARTQLPATLGKAQLELIDQELARNGFDRTKHHSVIVLHHHLFPMRNSGSQDLARRDILTDLPDLADMLPRWNTVCVLHGHRHRPFFGVYRVAGISDSTNKYFLSKASEDDAFDPDYELVACGIGQALNEEVREKDGQKRVLLPSLQVIDIIPEPQRFFQARVVVFPYQLERNKWLPVGMDGSLQSYASELVLPRIQRQLFHAECFTGEAVSIYTSYPLIPIAGKQSEKWFTAPLENACNALHVTLFDRSKRELLFRELIHELRETNKKNSIFSLLPFQLAGVYGFTAIFFGEDEIHQQAIEEFEEPHWKPLLREEPDQNEMRPKWLANHLESANYRIAEIVNEYHTDRRVPGDGSSIRVVDLGAGTGRTIRRIVNGLLDRNVIVEYRGLEISAELADEADRILREKYRRRHRLKPLAEETAKLVVQGEICAHLCSEGSGHWFRDIDVVVASYCLHHIPNNYRTRKMIADGSLLTILAERYFAEDPALNELSLADAVKGGYLFSDVPTSQKEEFFNYLDEVYGFWRGRNPPTLDKNVMADAEKLASRLERYLPNRQKELYQRIANSLKPGGRLIIADPNGFSSTFNRVNIFTDWRMAIAHFAEWTLVAKWLTEIGFVRLKVFRQMRLKTLQVVEVPVPDDWIDNAINGIALDYRAIFTKDLPFEGLEVEDQHLGYIVSATKP